MSRMLGWCLRHRVDYLVVAVGIFASLRWLLPMTKVEVFQDDDMSEFEVIVETPPGHPWSAVMPFCGGLKPISARFRKSTICLRRLECEGSFRVM